MSFFRVSLFSLVAWHGKYYKNNSESLTKFCAVSRGPGLRGGGGRLKNVYPSKLVGLLFDCWRTANVWMSWALACFALVGLTTSVSAASRAECTEMAGPVKEWRTARARKDVIERCTNAESLPDDANAQIFAAAAKQLVADKELLKNWKGVRIGMTRWAAMKSDWGMPKKINRTTTARGDHEQWVYGSGMYLYFDNNRLTAIQD